jgi:hypothetical protein
MEHKVHRAILTFDQANTICRNFLPIGEALFDYMDALRGAGFSAFAPLQEFTQSYCGFQSEIETHKRYLIESAKYLLGHPFPFPISDVEEQQLYRSPLLEELSRERDEGNGVPLSQLTDRYPDEIWRLEVDPCQRRSARASVEDSLAYQARWRSAQEEQRRMFRTDIARHASSVEEVGLSDKQRRYAFFSNIMNQNALPLGFELDSKRSRTTYPVFSKQVGANWDLCWTIEEPKAFYLNANEGRFTPYLQVRSRNLVGRIDSGETGEFLLIRHSRIVPGFFGAYGKFSDLGGLETMIKAHLFLYGLMAPTIERALMRHLA